MKTTEEIVKDYRVNVLRTGDDGGIGTIKYKTLRGSVIWSNGGGWEHVSFNPFKAVTPSWEDMCLLKDMFFGPEEVAIEIHPAKSQYVSNMEHCLHLWRCISAVQPLPPSIMVGVRKGQGLASVIKEIREATKG